MATERKGGSKQTRTAGRSEETVNVVLGAARKADADALAVLWEVNRSAAIRRAVAEAAATHLAP